MGTIEAGKFADMVVIDRDIFNIPEDELKDVQALNTYLAGNETYRKSVRYKYNSGRTFLYKARPCQIWTLKRGAARGLPMIIRDIDKYKSIYDKGGRSHHRQRGEYDSVLGNDK